MSELPTGTDVPSNGARAPSCEPDSNELRKALRRVNGAALFPLRGITPDGGCGCGDEECRTIGKHPAYRWSRLGQCERVFGEHGHGIATGARSGVFVVETDQKPGIDGEANLLSLGGLPRTFSVITPSKSLHRYFRMPEQGIVKTCAGELAPGVDVRGDGGMAVFPGSPHRLGGVYRVRDDVAVQSAPDWLLALVLEKDAKTDGQAKPPVASAILTAEEVDTLVASIVDAFRVLPSKDGQRNLFRMTVANLLLENGHSVDAAADIVEAVADGLGGDAHEFIATLFSCADRKERAR